MSTSASVECRDAAKLRVEEDAIAQCTCEPKFFRFLEISIVTKAVHSISLHNNICFCNSTRLLENESREHKQNSLEPKDS